MEFLENRRSKKIKNPQKIARKVGTFLSLALEKWGLLSLAFYNAPSLDTLENVQTQR